MTIDYYRVTKAISSQPTFSHNLPCRLTHFLWPLSMMNKIETTGWWQQTMANRTKCENSSHYSASSKGQQGKSAHLVHSFSTPLPSAFAFFFERLFVCVSAAIVPLLHVRVLAIPTTNYDFQLLPKTMMDVVYFIQMGCMGGTFTYHDESSTREAQEK